MKKITLILTALMLALTFLLPALAEQAAPSAEAIAEAAEEEGPEEITEGIEADAEWNLPDSTEITPDQLALFDKAMEGLLGVDYTPLSFLAEKDGIHCFLCRAQVVYPGAVPYYALVYISEGGVQNIWDLGLEAHSAPDHEEE